MVVRQDLALPITRFAVTAYLTFCTQRTLLEAVASSLTELFSPAIISERMDAMLAKYTYLSEDSLKYFRERPCQASRDSEFALSYVLENANSAAQQQKVVDALTFKCDILWAMLDALQHAYGDGNIPPGAFQPEIAE
jgi:pyrroloquinoline-quinone synthase